MTASYTPLRAAVAGLVVLSAATTLADEASKLPDVLQGRWYPSYWPCGSAESLKGGVVFDETTMTSTIGAYSCTFQKLNPAKMPPPEAIGEWSYRKTCVIPGDQRPHRQFGWMRMTMSEKTGQHLEANDSDNESGLFEAPVNPAIFEGRRCP